MSFSRIELAAGLAQYLVELESWRYTDGPEPAVITTADGGSFRFEAGVEVSGLAVGDVSGSASVTIDDGTDWGLIVGRGVELQGRRVRILRWVDGTIYERASVVLDGLVEGYEVAGSGEPLTLTVRSDPSSRSRIIPRGRVSGTTWPDSGNYSRDERAQGLRYPLLIGYPGARAGVAPRHGAPALLVQESSVGGDTADLVLLAGHPIEATTVRVLDFTDGTISAALVAVTHQLDGLGRRVAVASLAGSGLTVAKGRAYYQGHPATTGGGIRDPRRGGVLRGAGSVARYLLEAHSTIPLDGIAWEVASEVLDRYLIDCAITSKVRAWDWVAGELLPILPGRLAWGHRGLRPVLSASARTITAADAVGLISAANGARRLGPVRVSGDVRNEFAVHYQYDLATSEHREFVGLSGTAGRFEADPWAPIESDDARIYGSVRCARSAARYGVRPAEEIETAIVWDAGTAQLIAQAAAAELCEPTAWVDYELDAEWEWLEVGAVVLLTDSELSLSERLAVVGEPVPGPSSIRVPLRLLTEDVARSV